MINLHDILKSSYTSTQLAAFYHIKKFDNISHIRIVDSEIVEFEYHEGQWDHFLPDWLQRHLEDGARADIPWIEAKLIND